MIIITLIILVLMNTENNNIVHITLPENVKDLFQNNEFIWRALSNLK